MRISLASQLDFDLVRTDPRTPLHQMIGVISEENLSIVEARFAEWKVFIEAHVASMLTAEGDRPALPSDLYEEVANFIDKVFDESSLSLRMVIWYSLCTTLIRISNEFTEQEQVSKFLKESGLKDIIENLKKPPDKPKNPSNLN